MTDIFNNESIVHPSTAPKFFTNRHEIIKTFAEYLHEESPNKMICIHGDGGYGKTLLLNTLKDYYCKKLNSEKWDNLIAAGKAVHRHLKYSADAKPVPTAFIDFDDAGEDKGNTRQTIVGTKRIKDQLSKQGLNFPIYNLGLLQYYEKRGELTADKIQTIVSTTELSLLKGLFDFVPVLPTLLNVGSEFLKITSGLNIEDKYASYKSKWKIDEKTIEKITQAQPTIIEQELPKLLAKDLNNEIKILKSIERIAIFFDTHEAFWGSNLKMSDYDFVSKDKWLRDFLLNLEFNSGIVVVLAGRDDVRKKWSKIIPNSDKVSMDRIESINLGMLSEEYGREYLKKIAGEYQDTQLSDKSFREHLLEFSKKGLDNIHPEHLGLCADVCIAAKKANQLLTPEDFPKIEFDEKAKILVNRLLRYVDTELRQVVFALSACRYFDKAIYFHVGDMLCQHDDRFLNERHSDLSFKELKSLPFVWLDAKRTGLFRINDLLRHLVEELLDEEEFQIVIEAHKCLEEYFLREKSHNIIEAIYHANRFDQERSLQKWISLFDDSLLTNEFELCEKLIFLRNNLQVNEKLYESEMLRLEGDYYKATNRFTDAEEIYKKAFEVLEDKNNG